MTDTLRPAGHSWKFFRAGGFDQVRLDTGADLFALGELDQKLWVALSCPVAGTEFDAATLKLLDSDGDGHIRAPELLAAIEWLRPRLKDRDLLASGADPLPLAAIDDASDEGRRVLASAKRILSNLGKADAGAIGVADAADNAAIFGQTRFNGDGIITVRSAEDEGLAAVIAEIGAAYGTQPDRCGEPGIDRAALDAYIADANGFLEWQAAAGAHALPELADIAAAHAALAAVRAKVDDYFSRCRLAAYDERAATLLNGSDADFQAFARDNLSTPGEAVAALPLARAEAGRALPLGGALNPAWSAAMASFVTGVVTPLLGARDSLAESDWQALCGRLTGYADWQAARPTTPAAALPEERLRAGLAAREALVALLDADLALTEEAAAVDDVARMTRLVRDLGRFANNFVAFRDFYTRADKATFQAGTLYFDGRSCELCIRVVDPGKHATLATLSRICLVYCDCTRGGEKISIAAAFTAGDSDQLMVGRNGVFYDRAGNDWDATIVKIIDHPISLRQAFWSPYKKAARMIGEQMQKFAAARAQAADNQMAASIAAGAKKVETAPAAAAAPAKPGEAPKTPAQQAFDAGKFAGIFAAIGLAIGAIGTAVAAVITGFLGLKAWQMPLAIFAVMLLISGPAVLLAFLKLHSRTLGPLLDANGWAVNTRARINIPFGTSLTHLAKLPEGAERALVDPYAEKPTPWGLYVFLGVLITVGLTMLVRWVG